MELPGLMVQAQWMAITWDLLKLQKPLFPKIILMEVTILEFLKPQMVKSVLEWFLTHQSIKHFLEYHLIWIIHKEIIPKDFVQMEWL